MRRKHPPIWAPRKEASQHLLHVLSKVLISAPDVTPEAGFPYLRIWGLILLCHKPVVRFDTRCVRMEILTRGGGVWVFHPVQAANHAW